MGEHPTRSMSRDDDDDAPLFFLQHHKPQPHHPALVSYFKTIHFQSFLSLPSRFGLSAPSTDLIPCLPPSPSSPFPTHQIVNPNLLLLSISTSSKAGGLFFLSALFAAAIPDP